MEKKIAWNEQPGDLGSREPSPREQRRLAAAERRRSRRRQRAEQRSRRRGRSAALLGCALPVVLALTLLAPAVLAHPGDEGAAETSTWESALTGLRVKTVLLEKLGKDALNIDVEMKDGEAVLSGTVTERSTQELAEEAAKSVDGVSSVDNRLKIQVATSGSPGETAERAARDFGDEVADAALESRVHLRLFGEIGRYATRLQVEATDGVVSVRGKLPDRERKKLALKSAKATKGVKKVIDLVTVE
jgi:osmotically-inducible protein OsmY